MTEDCKVIRVGYLPLLDAALPIIAAQKAFAREEGLDLHLNKETSWANIRDRLATGHFDMAHMLAPMPIAANLGLTPMRMETIVPMALGLGGNAVTVSIQLYSKLEIDTDHAPFAAGKNGLALAKEIERRKAAGEPSLVLAVVHPHSAHNYDLRYWLAASGIDPDQDVQIIVVPPSLMPDALASGKVDGFCVGAPWNSVAVAEGSGSVLTTKSEIWRSSPEKVLGVSRSWADDHPEHLKAMVRALVRAAQWCESADNHEEMAQILSRPEYLGLEPALIVQSIKGQFAITVDGKNTVAEAADYFIPYRRAATFPWQSHALWFYAQMVRWGHAPWDKALVETVRKTYRPDIYRTALAPMQIPLPGASSKVEGALRFETPVGATLGELVLGPDGFFDAERFDPDDIEAYVRQQSRHLT